MAAAPVDEDNVVLDEAIDENWEPSQEEVEEYAVWLGMDKEKDLDLFWIAKEGLKAPLPSPWKPCKTGEGEIFYFNFKTGESVWDHPCDEFYRKLYQQKKDEKANAPADDQKKKEKKEKKEKKRKSETLGAPFKQGVKGSALLAQTSKLWDDGGTTPRGGASKELAPVLDRRSSATEENWSGTERKSSNVSSLSASDGAAPPKRAPPPGGPRGSAGEGDAPDREGARAKADENVKDWAATYEREQKKKKGREIDEKVRQWAEGERTKMEEQHQDEIRKLRRENGATVTDARAAKEELDAARKESSDLRAKLDAGSGGDQADLDRAERELKEAEQGLVDARSERDAAKHQINRCNNELEKLKKDFEQKNADLQKEAKLHAETRKQLNEDRAAAHGATRSLREKLSAAEQQAEQAIAEATAATARAAEQATRCEKLERDRGSAGADASGRVTDLEATLSKVRSELTSTKEQLVSTKEDLTSAREQVASTKEELTAARDQLAVNSAGESRGSRSSRGGAATKGLETTLSAVRAELSTAQQKLQQAEDDRDQLQREVASGAGEQDSAAKLEELQQARQKLERENESLQSGKQRLEAELDRIESARLKLQSDLDQQQSEGRRISSDLSQQRSELERLERELEQEQSARERAQAELEGAQHAQAGASEQHANFERLQSEVQTERAAAQRERGTAQAIRSDLERERGEAQRLRGDLDREQSEARRLRTDLDSMRRDLPAATAAAQEQVDAARQAASQAQAKLLAATAELAGTQSELRSRDAELTSTRSEFESLAEKLANREPDSSGASMRAQHVREKAEWAEAKAGLERRISELEVARELSPSPTPSGSGSRDRELSDARALCQRLQREVEELRLRSSFADSGRFDDGRAREEIRSLQGRVADMSAREITSRHAEDELRSSQAELRRVADRERELERQLSAIRTERDAAKDDLRRDGTGDSSRLEHDLKKARHEARLAQDDLCEREREAERLRQDLRRAKTELREREREVAEQRQELSVKDKEVATLRMSADMSNRTDDLEVRRKRRELADREAELDDKGALLKEKERALRDAECVLVQRRRELDREDERLQKEDDELQRIKGALRTVSRELRQHVLSGDQTPRGHEFEPPAREKRRGREEDLADSEWSEEEKPEWSTLRKNQVVRKGKDSLKTARKTLEEERARWRDDIKSVAKYSDDWRLLQEVKRKLDADARTLNEQLGELRSAEAALRRPTPRDAEAYREANLADRWSHIVGRDTPRGAGVAPREIAGQKLRQWAIGRASVTNALSQHSSWLRNLQREIGR